MRTIGIIGGMSWESTAVYYRLLNEGVRDRLGGLHSARLLMASVDFEPIAAMQRGGDWTGAGEALAAEARRLEAGGAEAVLIATNTMHRVYDPVAAAVDVPVLHIADATGRALETLGARRPALLGTAFTMEQPFYRDRLAAGFHMDVQVPDATEREWLHRCIFEELCLGHVETASRKRLITLIDTMARRGADAVILGCTELGLLVADGDAALPLVDTTRAHANEAVVFALAQTGSGKRASEYPGDQ